MCVMRSLIHIRNEVHRGYNLTDILVGQISFALEINMSDEVTDSHTK